MNRAKFDADLATITGRNVTDPTWPDFEAAVMARMVGKGSTTIPGSETRDGEPATFRERDYR